MQTSRYYISISGLPSEIHQSWHVEKDDLFVISTLLCNTDHKCLLFKSYCYFFRFLDGVDFTLHRYVRRFWLFIWTFVSPIIMIIIFFGSVINELIQPLQYTVFNEIIDVRS